MTFIALDDLEIGDPPPKCIGRCSIIPPSSTGVCSRRIYEGDIEYVELERGKGLACGDCVNRLLSPKRIPEEPEKGKRSRRGTGLGRGGARVHQGEDLKK